MIKIAYALWDRTADISDPVVREHVEELIAEMRDDFDDAIFVSDDIEAIFTQAANSEATHYVVLKSGIVITNLLGFLNGVEEFCKSHDFMVAGHIIHRKPFYPFLHQQMFILGLDRWQYAGAPRDTDWPSIVTHPTFSPECVHDEYTPWWLSPSDHDGRFERMPDKFGSGLIAHSLTYGHTVLNFPRSIRAYKIFTYPDEHSDVFGRGLLAMRQSYDPDLSFMAGRDSQRDYIEYLQRTRTKSATFVFNTEPLGEASNVDAHGPYDTIIGAAAGFKPFVLWSLYGHSQSQIVLYDWQAHNIQFWQDLHQNWNGRDLEGFLRQRWPHVFSDPKTFMLGGPVAMDRTALFRENWKTVLSYFASENDFAEQWEEYRALPHEFHEVNLLTDEMDVLLPHLNAKTLFWITNVFSFKRTLRFYGREAVAKRFEVFRDKVRPTRAVVVGRGPDSNYSGRL